MTKQATVVYSTCPRAVLQHCLARVDDDDTRDRLMRHVAQRVADEISRRLPEWGIALEATTEENGSPWLTLEVDEKNPEHSAGLRPVFQDAVLLTFEGAAELTNVLEAMDDDHLRLLHRAVGIKTVGLGRRMVTIDELLMHLYDQEPMTDIDFLITFPRDRIVSAAVSIFDDDTGRLCGIDTSFGFLAFSVHTVLHELAHVPLIHNGVVLKDHEAPYPERLAELLDSVQAAGLFDRCEEIAMSELEGLAYEMGPSPLFSTGFTMGWSRWLGKGDDQGFFAFWCRAGLEKFGEGVVGHKVVTNYLAYHTRKHFGMLKE